MHKIVVDVTTIDCINFMQQTQSWQRKPEHRRRFIDAMRMPQHHMQALYVCLACFCFFFVRFVSFRSSRSRILLDAASSIEYVLHVLRIGSCLWIVTRTIRCGICASPISHLNMVYISNETVNQPL